MNNRHCGSSRDNAGAAEHVEARFALHADEARRMLTLSGELDLDSAATLLARATPVIDHHRDQTLVLDMTDVTFLDSTGIGAIIELRHKALAAGGTIKLIGLRGNPRRVIELAALDRILT